MTTDWTIGYVIGGVILLAVVVLVTWILVLAKQIGDEAPKMLSIGLHCRLAGRPGRLAALAYFLDHVQKHERVWVCRRVDIARHWIERHPHRAAP